jgi:hypothetical protein
MAMVLMARSNLLLKVPWVRVMPASWSFTFGIRKSQQVTSQVSWNDEEALMADPHPLMLLLLGYNFLHLSC